MIPKTKTKRRAESAAWDLVLMGKVDRSDWPEVARLVADAIREDRDRVPPGEEDTLP